MSKKKKRKYTKWIGSDDDYNLYSSEAPPSISEEEDFSDPLCLHYSKAGVFFGRASPEHPKAYIGKPTEYDGHVLVVGGSGTGKSTGIAKPTLKTWPHAMFVTDIKGELSDQYGTLFENGLVNRPYLVIDPTQINGPGYDPFWWIMNDDEDRLVSNIKEIAYALVPDIPNNINKFWDDCERDYLSAFLLYSFTEGLSFSEAMNIIISGTITEIYKLLEKSSDICIRMLLGDSINLKPEHLACIDKGLRNKILVFALDPQISHLFRGVREGAACISWDDLKNYNIFLRIPEERIEQWGAAVNLMYTQLIRYLERRPDCNSIDGATTMPILILMDEFARFGKLQHLPDAISTLRSKKVSFCLMIQSLAQLDKIYGQNDRRIILDNCSYKAILGANDGETQKYLCELIGSTKVLQKSVSEHFDDLMDTTGYSQQLSEARELRVFPHELASITDIILISPFGVQRIEKFRCYDISDELFHTSTVSYSVQSTLTIVLDTSKPETDDNIKIVPCTIEVVETNSQTALNNLSDEVDKMLTINKTLEKEKMIKHQAEVLREIAISSKKNIMKNSNISLLQVGKLVVKYFPEVNSVRSGNKSYKALQGLPW